MREELRVGAVRASWGPDGLDLRRSPLDAALGTRLATAALVAGAVGIGVLMPVLFLLIGLLAVIPQSIALAVNVPRVARRGVVRTARRLHATRSEERADPTATGQEAGYRDARVVSRPRVSLNGQPWLETPREVVLTEAVYLVGTGGNQRSATRYGLYLAGQSTALDLAHTQDERLARRLRAALHRALGLERPSAERGDDQEVNGCVLALLVMLLFAVDAGLCAALTEPALYQPLDAADRALVLAAPALGLVLAEPIVSELVGLAWRGSARRWAQRSLGLPAR